MDLGARVATGRRRLVSAVVVLLAGGLVGLAPAGAATGSWSFVGDRKGTWPGVGFGSLAGGGLIAAGGDLWPGADPENGPFSTAVTEVFDPVAGTWSRAGNLPRAIARPLLTLLPDGRVLATGGIKNDAYDWFAVSDVSVFSPTTRTWSSSTPFTGGRVGHQATVIADGRVLLTGGYFDNSASGEERYRYAQIWDPATGAWSAAGYDRQARVGHSATLLPGGKVLIAGGGTASAKLWNPATNQFVATGNLNHSRAYHSGFVLRDGRVLIVGGGKPPELYDPRTGTFSVAADPGISGTPVLLGPGRVGVVGNDGMAEYVPRCDYWEHGPGPVNDHTYVVGASDGSVVALGGGSAERYRPGPAPATNGLAVSRAVVWEGDAGAAARFVVSLPKPAASPVSFSYATVAGTGTGADYEQVSGTATIPAGSRSAPVGVGILSDTSPETSENFELVLTGASAPIGCGRGTATILDDESQPAGVAVAGGAILEGASGTVGARFAITLRTAAATDVVVSYVTADGTALSPADFTAKSGSVKIPAGKTSAIVAVPVVGDTAAEPDEGFTLRITSATGGVPVVDPTARMTVRADEGL